MVTRAQHHQAGTPPAVNRPPSHHLDGEMLLAYAAGNLGEAASVLVATHLSWCPKCRGALAAAEVISHIGARPEVNLGAHARAMGLL